MDISMLLLIGLFFLLLAVGFPVSFALTGTAILGTINAWGVPALYQIVSTTYGESTNFILIAIPLFILMANFLQQSGIADDLYGVIHKWSGNMRGGLAMGTVVICAIFAAMAGISSVATVTMGLIALPAMLERGYNRSMVLGSIMAGGALGILIPPSIIMIIYGGIAEVSVGKLFMGGLLPGALLACLFIAYIFLRCLINPKLGPALNERYSMREKLAILTGVILPVLLVILVLGSIYFGVTTPTEAAGVGALGALGCMAWYRRMKWENIRHAILTTVRLNAMIMWLIIGASAFTHYLAFVGLQDSIQAAFLNLEVSRWWILIFTQVVFFFMGMVLEPAAIITLVGPIFVPIIKQLGFDPLWFGILFVMNMTMGYITPPFGFNLFILKGVAPEYITMTHIYRSIIPFCALQAAGIVLVILFPEIATWIPSQM